MKWDSYLTKVHSHYYTTPYFIHKSDKLVLKNLLKSVVICSVKTITAAEKSAQNGPESVADFFYDGMQENETKGGKPQQIIGQGIDVIPLCL